MNTVPANDTPASPLRARLRGPRAWVPIIGSAETGMTP
jgi:hypothetical protein